MKRVILDTNFLIYCAENKIDYVLGIMDLMEEGYNLFVPDKVIDELRDLSLNSEKLSDRDAARLALKLLEVNNVDIIRTFGNYADEVILKLARTGIVATLDRDLKKKIGKAIVIQGIKKIAFE